MEMDEQRGQANRPIDDLSFRNAGFRTALYTYDIVLATLLLTMTFTCSSEISDRLDKSGRKVSVL